MPISLLKAGMISPSWIWIDSLGTVTRASKKSLTNKFRVCAFNGVLTKKRLQTIPKFPQDQHSPLPKCLQISAWASIICPHRSIHPQPASDEGPVPPVRKFITISAGFRLGAAPQRTFQSARKQIGLLKPPWTVLQIKGTEQDFGSGLLV